MTAHWPTPGVRIEHTADSNRCIADIDQTFSLGDQQRRVALHQGKAPCTASSFGIAYRDARNGQALSRVPAPVLAA